MRRVVYYVAVSLDGYIAHEDGSLDGFLFEGDHLQAYVESLRRFDTVLMGRHTYALGLAEGKTDPYPELESWVFSRTLAASPDPRVHLEREDAVERVRLLRAADRERDVWLCGGAVLATELLRADLLDELWLKVHPFVMGRGKSLFTAPLEAAGGTRSLELLEEERFESGVRNARYAFVRP